jgi:hypothetical protein
MEIEELVALFERLASRLSNLKNDVISVSEVEDGLYILLSDTHGFSWRGSLWDVEIEEEEAFQMLAQFDFAILGTVVDTSPEIVPECLWIHYKVRFKIKGMVWVIHKYDADPFPSNPHAHQLENNIKLDLSNGNCYRKRKLEYTVSKKELLEVRAKASRVFKGELPELEV